MKTKLTLSVDKDLVDFAHKQARRNGQTISAMVSAHLRKQKQAADKAKVPGIDEMVGLLKGYNIDDSKEGIRTAYAEKYLDRH